MLKSAKSQRRRAAKLQRNIQWLRGCLGLLEAGSACSMKTTIRKSHEVPRINLVIFLNCSRGCLVSFATLRTLRLCASSNEKSEWKYEKWKNGLEDNLKEGTTYSRTDCS